jgi:CRP-like cAMP-binding protein
MSMNCPKKPEPQRAFGERPVSRSNVILASLPASDTAALRPHLRRIELRQKRVLHRAGDHVNLVYFPTSAVISLVAALTMGETTEAAMVGYDGAVGMASALDGRLALTQAIVQRGGEAMVCDADGFRRAVLRSETLLSRVMRNEHALFAQAQQSAACMANHALQARLCRWLLRARDLAASDDLPFTQEYLGEMLGVRRSSVTLVAHALQAAGMVQYSRGKIRILDVERLKDSACECYEAVKRNIETGSPCEATARRGTANPPAGVT